MHNAIIHVSCELEYLKFGYWCWKPLSTLDWDLLRKESWVHGENYSSVVSISQHHGHESNKQMVFQRRVDGIEFEVYFLITNHTSLNYTMFNYHRVEISYKYLSVMTTRWGTAFTVMSLVIMVSILSVIPCCKPTFKNSIAHYT